MDSSKIILSAGDDAADAAWFKLEVKELKSKTVLIFSNANIVIKAEIERDVLPCEYRVIKNDGLAFDHAKIVLYALDRLRNKLEYSPLAFYMLPGYFTLSELQQIYEVILDKELLAPAFRRKMTPLVEETGQLTGDAGHRPSRLYRRKTEKNSII